MSPISLIGFIKKLEEKSSRLGKSGTLLFNNTSLASPRCALGRFFFRSSVKFEKTALTTNQLVAGLAARHMDVGDPAWAVRLLDSINYYRLATYWYQFRITTDAGDHVFRPGTSLKEVHRIYKFDSELRGLFFRSIESFEISLRKHLSAYLALKYDPFVHLDPTRMKDRKRWADTISRVHNEYSASNEEFARHNKEKYGEYHLPAIWVTVELMTLGGLRHLFQNWADRSDRQAIAQCYGLEEPVFDSLLEHLETIRNFCAHHARLWNRHITKSPKIPKKLQAPLTARFNPRPQALPNVYNSIILLDYVDYFVSGEQRFFESVSKLLDSYPEIDPTQMGFPQH